MPVDLQRLLSVDDFRRQSQRTLPKAVFEFIDGGAEDEVTLRENRAAFERRRIVPRILTDVSNPVLATDLAGTKVAAPLVISPMGSCMLAWPEADLAIARAAHAHGLPYTMSTMATVSIEQMARSTNGPLWFQLYVFKDHAFNAKLVERARAAGFAALVVTVDLQAGGKREKDLRNGISIPLRFGVRHVVEAALRPGWTMRFLTGGMPQYENVRGQLGDESAGMTIAAKVGQNLDAAFDWTGLARLRDLWPGKLLVKGVMHPQDAVRLRQMGVDGLWVSNHGGRQLDGAMASADALPAVAAAVKGMPIVIDSGVRRGGDILKARALGATAAAIGRPALYGASVAGQPGVARVLEILIEELTRSMRLAGVPAVDGVDAGLLG